MSQPISRGSIESCITSSQNEDVEEDGDGDNTFGDVDDRVADHFKTQRDRRMSTRRSSIAALGAKLNATRCDKSSKHILHLLRYYYEQEQYQTMVDEEVTIDLPIDFDNLTFAEAVRSVVELSEENGLLKEQLPKACAENHSKDLTAMLYALKQKYDEITKFREEPSDVESTNVSELISSISRRVENIKKLQLMSREKLEELEILKSIERL